MTGGQSWPNYIGSKRGNPQACLTNPVFTPFPLKVAWSGISLIGHGVSHILPSTGVEVSCMYVPSILSQSHTYTG